MILLDSLERQIVAALQLDPRCPWRKMAAVLGEPERTVARRGAQLLESGAVSIAAVRPPSIWHHSPFSWGCWAAGSSALFRLPS
ncbi:Lrp/AsnC family transcriptional regulator [uncultured Arthrobacter sp.]|uniref:Lrp/AsnC family transcriptional regulator n=1 Tax=uncultured Arthrobacter sp. TaxID=114050 RepID=UPI0028D8B264|nr:Lrp/AsnC family transcriptional regulator [uncultured Arthrobacter sp.]